MRPYGASSITSDSKHALGQLPTEAPTSRRFLDIGAACLIQSGGSIAKATTTYNVVISNLQAQGDSTANAHVTSLQLKNALINDGKFTDRQVYHNTVLAPQESHAAAVSTPMDVEEAGPSNTNDALGLLVS